jgi:hypothetical protein
VLEAREIYEQYLDAANATMLVSVPEQVAFAVYQDIEVRDVACVTALSVCAERR